jgi:hypothetical protein
MIILNTDGIKSMIGLCFSYHNAHCRVIEVIEDGPSIILEDLDQYTRIQANQHGEASRKVPKTYTISVLSKDQSEFTPSFLELEPLDT